MLREIVFHAKENERKFNICFLDVKNHSTLFGTMVYYTNFKFINSKELLENLILVINSKR